MYLAFTLSCLVFKGLTSWRDDALSCGALLSMDGVPSLALLFAELTSVSHGWLFRSKRRDHDHVTVLVDHGSLLFDTTLGCDHVLLWILSLILLVLS